MTSQQFYSNKPTSLALLGEFVHLRGRSEFHEFLNNLDMDIKKMLFGEDYVSPKELRDQLEKNNSELRILLAQNALENSTDLKKLEKKFAMQNLAQIFVQGFMFFQFFGEQKKLLEEKFQEQNANIMTLKAEQKEDFLKFQSQFHDFLHRRRLEQRASKRMLLWFMIPILLFLATLTGGGFYLYLELQKSSTANVTLQIQNMEAQMEQQTKDFSKILSGVEEAIRDGNGELGDAQTQLLLHLDEARTELGKVAGKVERVKSQNSYLNREVRGVRELLSPAPAEASNQ